MGLLYNDGMPELKEKEPVRQAEQIKKQPEGEVVYQPEEKRSLEVESVIEKIERQARGDQQQNDVQDDVSGATVVPASDDQPAVTLPVTKTDIVKGKKLKVTESWRWLVEWAIKQIKKFHGRVRYQEER